jgi:uncharacterized membrane protein YoaK (UPF0700 family)
MTMPSPQTLSPGRWRAQRVRDALLAALALAAGSIDALSWLALGKVFSAFMTGNVVFIAVGLQSHDSALALRAGIALCAFGTGAWLTAALMPRENPAVLWPSRVTVGLLGCSLVQLVFWALWLAVGGRPGSSLQMVMLAVSALAMGMQTATAVALGVHAVFTTAATATWTVLLGDAARWSATRIERRRLALVLGAMLLGALLGAFLLARARIWMPVLPLVLTAGVAVVARLRLQHVDPARTMTSSAPHPLTRAFGRTIGDGREPAHGR